MRFHLPSFVFGALLAAVAAALVLAPRSGRLGIWQDALVDSFVRVQQTVIDSRPASPSEDTAGRAALWVNTDRLNIRSCPSVTCPTVGRLAFGQKITVFQERARMGSNPTWRGGGLGRSAVSGHKQAAHARRRTRGLGTVRLTGSDDLETYWPAFVQASRYLLAAGQCTLDDFKTAGGWIKSTTTYRSQPVYFTYCGGIAKANRVYLDAASGRIFK